MSTFSPGTTCLRRLTRLGAAITGKGARPGSCTGVGPAFILPNSAIVLTTFGSGTKEGTNYRLRITTIGVPSFAGRTTGQAGADSCSPRRRTKRFSFMRRRLAACQVRLLPSISATGRGKAAEGRKTSITTLQEVVSAVRTRRSRASTSKKVSIWRLACIACPRPFSRPSRPSCGRPERKSRPTTFAATYSKGAGSLEGLPSLVPGRS